MLVNVTGHLFDPEQLQQLVQTVQVPDGKKGALVGTVDANGAKVAVVMNLADQWQVQAAVAHTWDGDTQVGAKVIGSW